MELHERKSGLVVPKEKPKPPARRYGPTEIQDQERRETARQAFLLLWDALDLTNPPGGIILPGGVSRELHEFYYRFYRFMGEALLGEDCPEKEQLT